MEEDEQSDDSSGSESELQERAEQLQAAVDGNPYHYDNHVQLIGLLRQLGDLDGARKARNAMSEAFPLTEGMWLGWIRDELPLVSIPEASLELRQLFERATEDYLSVEVWLQYVQFTMDQMSVVSEGVAFPRDVCERAIVRCGLHVSKAGELWDMYRGFEIALLKSLQEMQQNSTEDDNLKPQVEAQFERVDKLFKRQLAVPLIGMQDTFEQYRQFSDSSIAEGGLPAYEMALKRLEILLPFENELLSSTPPSLESYQTYLDHVKKAKDDPMFINTLYQRAVADHCLVVDLWKDYLTYLNSSFGETSSVLLPPHRQAVRNCPWVCELWVSCGLALERVGADETETIAVFEKGLTGGNFTSPSDSLTLWTAYLDYLRRRVRLHDDQEVKGDPPELIGLRKTFKRARDTLETEFGRYGDPTDSLSLYQARLESRCYDNLEECRFLWDDIMSRHGREAKYWIQYADMERYYGDPEKCRKILIRGVNSASDDPELVMETLLQFEREEGDLASYETAREKCTAQLKRLEKRKEKAAEKEGQQKESKKQAKKAAKKSAGSGADAGGKGKSLPQQQKHKKPGGGKRSRVQKGQVFFEEDDDEENEGELQPKRQKVDVPKTDATMETEPPRQPETPPTSVSMAAEPKRSIPEPPGMPKKEGEREGDGEGVEKGGEEKRTVFVSNLKMSVTKEDLEEKFSPCGTISEVRLIKSQSRGRANAFAYVEFAATESVQKALQLEHTELNGRIVFVSQHREKGGGGKTQQKQAGFQGNNKATVFVSNLQHNTDEQTLKDLFEKCGEVKEVRLVRNRDGRPKGFAYIEFTNEATAGSAVLQLDNHLLGMKRLKVAISNPPKKKGDGPAAPSADRTSHSRPIKDDGGFVRPSFIPARIKAQEQSEVPRKRANIGLVPRVLAKQNKEKGEEGTEGVKEGESGKEGEGGGGGGTDAMDVGKAAPQKMSNDDFRKLLDKT